MRQATADEIAEIKAQLVIFKAASVVIEQLYAQANALPQETGEEIIVKTATMRVASLAAKGIADEADAVMASIGLDPDLPFTEQLADFHGSNWDGNYTLGARSEDGPRGDQQ